MPEAVRLPDAGQVRGFAEGAEPGRLTPTEAVKILNDLTVLHPKHTTSMRRFHLVRTTDVSGVSGTGIVVEGVQFTDGSVCYRWFGKLYTHSLAKDIETVIAIHGHEGATTLKWIDQ